MCEAMKQSAIFDSKAVEKMRETVGTIGSGQNRSYADGNMGRAFASEPRRETAYMTDRHQAAAIDQKHAAMEHYQEAQLAEHNNLRVQTSLAMEALSPGLAGSLRMLSAQINRWMNHQGFWTSRNVGEKLALMHSEISEAMEADRKNLPSDHIGGFTGVEEEMADVVIRVLDFCHEHGLRLPEAIEAKMAFNLSRPHMHGKKY